MGCGLALLILVIFTGLSVARIHSKAPGTSLQLEHYSAELHDYLHDTYGPSFGAHGMETMAAALHETLHEWEHGAASEADVFEDLNAAHEAFDSMTKQFKDNGFLNGPDQDKEVKSLYREVHKYLALVEQFFSRVLEVDVECWMACSVALERLSHTRQDKRGAPPDHPWD